MKILLTGGCGFIGSAVARYLITQTKHSVVNIDCMTYAASRDSTAQIAKSNRYKHFNVNINNSIELKKIFEYYQPDAVMHLAAESHVDRSIDNASIFIQTNVLGTYNILEVSRRYWESLKNQKKEYFRFHHVSTDEVFGHLELHDPAFTEKNPYNPRSPYSASKASSDHLVRAWHHTYGMPTFVTNTTNNYGSWHFPEKLIPLITINAILGKKLPVYGNGKNIRDWLFVDDHAEALVKAVEEAVPGESYAIGANQPRTNLQVVETICDVLDSLHSGTLGSHKKLIHYVTDRPGHDFRYQIDPSKAEQSLNWRAKHNFEEGIKKTVEWYLNNRTWWEGILKRHYSGNRLGTII